jgi:hypothetical protein
VTSQNTPDTKSLLLLTSFTMQAEANPNGSHTFTFACSCMASLAAVLGMPDSELSYLGSMLLQIAFDKGCSKVAPASAAVQLSSSSRRSTACTTLRRA